MARLARTARARTFAFSVPNCTNCDTLVAALLEPGTWDPGPAGIGGRGPRGMEDPIMSTSTHVPEHTTTDLNGTQIRPRAVERSLAEQPARAPARPPTPARP